MVNTTFFKICCQFLQAKTANKSTTARDQGPNKDKMSKTED